MGGSMEREMSFTTKIMLALFLSVGVPVLGSLMFNAYIPEWRLENESLHAMMESLGGCLALTLGSVLLLSFKNSKNKDYPWIACALFSMGTLDIFHASEALGKLFVWYHSTAHFAGGLFFSMVLLPEAWKDKVKTGPLLLATLTGTLVFGAGSLLAENSVPAMVLNGHFTPLARLLNISGGIGFLLAAYHFFFKARKKNEPGDFLFAIHTTLFGVAGILFEMSVLWNGSWWLWHFLRLVAYLTGFVFAVKQFIDQADMVQQAKSRLEATIVDLEEARSRAEKASQAKSRFLAQMSHELRTPLNSILGFSQLLILKKQHLDSDQLHQIKHIEKSGELLLGLITDILDFSKIEEGKQEVFLEPVSLIEIVQETLEAMKPIANRSEVTLNYDLDNWKHLRVHADKFRLKQVLFNLVSNGIKYNVPSGTVDLTCKQEKGKDRFTLMVTDTGRGIPEEDLDKVFEPFERLAMSNTAIPGSGIGLTISKKLVEMMQGSLTIKSRVNQGTTFFITLSGYPDTMEVDQNNEEPVLISEKIRDSGYEGDDNRKAVLYIEDNEVNLFFMEDFFKNFSNIKLVSAKDAELGLQMASSQNFDLILMDILLPGMNGIEACRQLKKSSRTENLPVLAISALAAKRDIEKAMQSGFDDYFTKPVDCNALRSVLEKKLGSLVSQSAG